MRVSALKPIEISAVWAIAPLKSNTGNRDSPRLRPAKAFKGFQRLSKAQTQPAEFQRIYISRGGVSPDFPANGYQ